MKNSSCKLINKQVDSYPMWQTLPMHANTVEGSKPDFKGKRTIVSNPRVHIYGPSKKSFERDHKFQWTSLVHDGNIGSGNQPT